MVFVCLKNMPPGKFTVISAGLTFMSIFPTTTGIVAPEVRIVATKIKLINIFGNASTKAKLEYLICIMFDNNTAIIILLILPKACPWILIDISKAVFVMNIDSRLLLSEKTKF